MKVKQVQSISKQFIGSGQGKPVKWNFRELYLSLANLMNISP
jgi:hypothetical protein